MTKYRQLNDDEKALTSKNTIRNIQEAEIYNYKIKRLNLMIEEGIDMDAREQKLVAKKNKAVCEGRLKELNFAITEAQKQLKHGVAQKEPEEEKEDDEK